MRTIANILGGLQVFVAIMAIPAGLSLITRPNGSGLGLPIDMLKDSPFEDYLIPGLILLLFNGLLNIGGSVLSFKKHHLLGLAGLALGIVLCIWILVQVYYTGWVHFLQPLFLGIGILEILLALVYHSRRS